MRAIEAQAFIGGRVAVARGCEAVNAAIELTHGFFQGMIEKAGEVHRAGGTLNETFEATRAHFGPKFG